MLNLVSAEHYRRGRYGFKRPRSSRHTLAHFSGSPMRQEEFSLILILSDINMQGMGVILTAAVGVHHHRGRRSVDVERGQHHLGDRIIVERIIRRELIVPLYLSRLGIERHWGQGGACEEATSPRAATSMQPSSHHRSAVYRQLPAAGRAEHPADAPWALAPCFLHPTPLMGGNSLRASPVEFSANPGAVLASKAAYPNEGLRGLVIHRVRCLMSEGMLEYFATAQGSSWGWR